MGQVLTSRWFFSPEESKLEILRYVFHITLPTKSKGVLMKMKQTFLVSAMAVAISTVLTVNPIQAESQPQPTMNSFGGRINWI